MANAGSLSLWSTFIDCLNMIVTWMHGQALPARLAVDGERYRYFEDVPVQYDNRDELDRCLFEMTFDGTQIIRS